VVAGLRDQRQTVFVKLRIFGVLDLHLPLHLEITVRVASTRLVVGRRHVGFRLLLGEERPQYGQRRLDVKEKPERRG
jgi:hypothetical protein